MGKATQLKIAKRDEAEAKLQASFIHHNRALKIKAQEPVVTPNTHLVKYNHLVIRDISGFESRLKSKDPHRQLMELVRHAFARYPVCQALQSAWDNVTQKPSLNPHRNVRVNLNVDFKAWYICVAAGGSLYKEHAKDYLTKKEVHALVTCPHSLNMAQALCYAVSKSAGANEGIALRIAKSKLAEMSFNEFWKTVIRFFSVHQPASINDINDLSDYIQAKKVESVHYTMSGKNLEGLRKGMTDWHYELRRIKVMGNAVWEGTYLPDEEFETFDSSHEKVKWTMHQIKTAKELAQEGTRMHHCVYSYKDGCISGRLSIWSLSRIDYMGVSHPKITIELRDSGYIAQARGFGNRVMRPEERSIVHQWAKKHDLYF